MLNLSLFYVIERSLTEIQERGADIHMHFNFCELGEQNKAFSAGLSGEFVWAFPASPRAGRAIRSWNHYFDRKAFLSREWVPYQINFISSGLCVCMCAYVYKYRDWVRSDRRIRLSMLMSRIWLADTYLLIYHINIREGSKLTITINLKTYKRIIFSINIYWFFLNRQ